MLNTNNLTVTEELAKEVRTWCVKDIYSTIAYVGVNLWPRNELPRDFSVVMASSL